MFWCLAILLAVMLQAPVWAQLAVLAVGLGVVNYQCLVPLQRVMAPMIARDSAARPQREQLEVDESAWPHRHHRHEPDGHRAGGVLTDAQRPPVTDNAGSAPALSSITALKLSAAASARRRHADRHGAATVHRALGRIELGLAQLAILVGVGGSEPGITALLHAQLAVGLVQVAVLVEIELVEACGQARIGLGFSRLMRPSLLTSSLAQRSPPWPRRPCCQRGSSSRESLPSLFLSSSSNFAARRGLAASLRSMTPSPLVSSLAGRCAGVVGVSAASAIPEAEVPSSRASSRGYGS
jgi:hypothetical protein